MDLGRLYEAAGAAAGVLAFLTELLCPQKVSSGPVAPTCHNEQAQGFARACLARHRAARARLVPCCTVSVAVVGVCGPALALRQGALAS